MFRWIRKKIKLFYSRIKPEKQKIRKERILEVYKTVEIPETIPKDIGSREYKIFKKEERISRISKTLYENLCNLSERIIKVKPDKATEKKILKAIRVTHLNITPTGVASLAILSCLFICVLTIIAILSNIFFGIGISLGYGLIILLLSVFLAYYLYVYPMHLEKIFLTRSGSEIVMLILYMVIYMRNNPNLEGAIYFASRNLTGPLAYDMRKIIWDVEVGKYKTVDEALIDYTTIWSEDKYFIESIQLLRSSLQQSEQRRLTMLDEAIETSLRGTQEKAKHYSQELKMPILLIHALGILLPVMGLVMFPIIGIFLNVSSEILFIGYDIILPLVILFFIRDTLERRPATFSQVSVSEHPDMPPKNRFFLKTKIGVYSVPVWPAALVVALPVVLFGAYSYITAIEENLLHSIIITVGITIAFILYYFLSSFQRVKVREETRKTENEFTEALFQLGNQVSSGVPIEVGIERSTKAIGELSIKKFFLIILRNMERLGMTFSQAIFDRDYGAILFYPSKLIKSVMRTVVDSTKKGVQIAAMTMLNISKYLRDIHASQEQIHDMLDEVLSSLRFQAFLLTPLISGIIVTMATIIIRIMNRLGTAVSSMRTAYAVPFLPWGQIGVTPGEFQLVVSIYFIQSSILVAMFINGIENGEDDIGKNSLTVSILSIGFIIYVVSLLASLAIFGPLTALPGL